MRDAQPESSNAGMHRAPRLALHWQILIGLILGAAAGLAVNRAFPRLDGKTDPRLQTIIDNVALPIGQVFLRLIFMVVLPLLFSALVLGIVGIGDVRKLGKLGLRTFGHTLLLSGISVAIGLALVNTLRPGDVLSAEQRADLKVRFDTDAQRSMEQARKAKPLRDVLLDIIPRNPLQEMVGALDGSSPGGGMLAVMFFSLAFGVALLFARQRAAPVVAVLEGVHDALMAIIGFAMRLAPLGVAALIFSITAALGLDVLRTLAVYVLTVVGGLALHLLVVYSLYLFLLARLNPLRFFSRIGEAMMTAFATSSSNATLPTSLRVAEEKLGLRREVSSFVLTVGSTANQNGTALYEGVTVLFLAQLFGMDLTLTKQIQVALLCVLAGVGTAGVPGGSLPLVVLVLQTVGIPAESIAVILGVDRLLDMSRTVVNVTGDLAIAACMDRSEPKA